MMIEDYISLRESGNELESIAIEHHFSSDMAWTLEFGYICRRNDISVEKAVSYIQNSNTVVLEGKIFDSFKQACDFYNTDARYLYKKQKKTGIAKEELLREKINKGLRRLPLKWEEKTYTSFSELCREHNLDPIKVQSLIDNRNISREEAFQLALEHPEGISINK